MKFATVSIKKIAKTISIIAILLLSFSPAKAQFTINNVYGNLVDCDTMTRGIYIVWWDHDFDYSGEVDVLLDTMISYRNTCLNDMAMIDPPNPLDSFYYNVYIHSPGNSNDIFNPFGWGNGQGTDSNGYPFLTLPNGVLNDWVNNSHETFHIFQYSANAPGFSYSGDSQWYIEASANWFAAKQNLSNPRAFVEAESLVRIPQVPLWLSYDNYPSAYPANWQRYVHQYAMALYLYYLTDVAGVPDSIITSGMYSGTSELPQEYFFNQLGGDVFRNHFIDFAAHMTNQFDFILPVQAATNENEWNTYADLWDDNEFIQTYNNTGSGGWYQPDDSVTTTAWSFNTYKLLNSNTETYTFEINGNPTGSYGDNAYFQGKVLVQNSVTGASFHDLIMSNDHQGSLSLNMSPDDTALYFIIASMPEIFQDSNPEFQLFSYEMNISLGSTTGISTLETSDSKLEIARYNYLGQSINKNTGGLQIILYEDGTSEKIFLRPNF
ncbi:MAG: hypothetical protein ACI8P3_002687 [Saprospiraceae bacterium]|jgi:hypothetical protein